MSRPNLSALPPASNRSPRDNFLNLLPSDAMGHILELLIDELPRGRHRAACANVVRFCQAKGNAGCSEAEWRTAAMLLHAKRMQHINQRKALIENG